MTTERNRTLTKTRHELRTVRMAERTLSLIGKSVYFRSQGNRKPSVGTVVEVITKGDEAYPTDAKRNVGTYLKIKDSSGMLHIKARYRVKPVGA